MNIYIYNLDGLTLLNAAVILLHCVTVIVICHCPPVALHLSSGSYIKP